MKRYFATRSRIPSERLLEIRVEDFESDPGGALRWIGAELELPALADVEAVRPDSGEEREADRAVGGGARANEIEREIERAEHVHRIVEKEWGFAIDELGYERPIEEH